jgi:hypothetical protein
MIMQQIRKLSKSKNEKLIKQLQNEAEVYANASLVPIITLNEIDPDENLSKFRLSFQALDRAQISLSNENIRVAISELNEAKYNLSDTKIGITYIPKIDEKINSYKNQLGIKPDIEIKNEGEPKTEKEDIRSTIAKRRVERKRRIKEALGNKN